MKRKALTAAEREVRSEANFMKGRAARDAVRRQHMMDMAKALDRSALIMASYRARQRALHLALMDRAARRKDRIKRRRDLMDEYRTWMAQAPAWLWSDGYA